MRYLRAPFIAMLTAAACAAETAADAPADTDETIENDACVDDSSVSMLQSGFTAREPVDSVGIRLEQLSAGADPDSGTGWIARVNDERGLACKTATNFDECRKRYESYRLLNECPPTPPTAPASRGCSISYLVWTRGDEIGSAVGVQDQIAFMIPIDTKTEAFFVAANRGFGGQSCAKGLHSTFLRYPSGSMELGVIAVHCDTNPPVVERVRIVVTPEADVREIGRERLGPREGLGQCSMPDGAPF